MTILLIGANYRDLPLSELEILERNADRIRFDLFDPNLGNHAIDGGVVLTTCNRFEIYLDVENVEDATRHALEVIANRSGLDIEYCRTKLRILSGSMAYQHLFKVTSGLDSMVVGESEIAGQIKRALAETQEQGYSSRITEALFQRASSVSKKVASETGLGAAGRSLITSALVIVKDLYFSLQGKQILVIGTGAYARVVISALGREQVGQIYVYSPSGRAEQFSKTHATTPIDEKDYFSIIQRVDLVVACSGNHGVIVKPEHVNNRKTGLFPIIDLALSSDIDPSIKALTNIVVINLEEIHRNAPPEHHETIAIAMNLIEKAVSEFEQDLAARANDPLVRALRTHVSEIVEQEVARIRRRSGDEIADQVALSLRLVTKTIFHKPTIHAKKTATDGEQDEYQKAIQVLFGFEVDMSQGNG